MMIFAVFDLVRHWAHGGTAFLYAFDLIELNGNDLRREPLEKRKAALTRLLVRAHHGVHLNEHLEAEGALVFEHACRLGLEGIVSKRKRIPLPLWAEPALGESEKSERTRGDAPGEKTGDVDQTASPAIYSPYCTPLGSHEDKAPCVLSRTDCLPVGSNGSGQVTSTGHADVATRERPAMTRER